MKRNAYLLLSLMCIYLLIWALKEETFSCVNKESSSEALSSVTVPVKSTNVSSTANNKGHYIINAPLGNSVLNYVWLRS